jgi:large subunit ribosomal protein L6
MSRIGSRAVGIPASVTVEVKDRTVRLKGSKGELSYGLPVGIGAEIDGSLLRVKRLPGHDGARALHGLARSIIQNMVIGVSEGHERKLEIVGVGYKAQPKGRSLVLSLGFSHPIDFPLPEGIEVLQDEKNKNLLTFRGTDKQLVGQVSANLRSLRPPEPYKGKGIRYTDEIIRRKPGKAAAAKGAVAAA